MKSLKNAVKAILPSGVAERYRQWKRRRLDRVNASRSTEEVFTRIYREGEWVGQSEEGGLCSGEGSASGSIVDPYVERVEALFRVLSLQDQRVVDLGCGDFRVGRRLSHLGKSYLGVDIVEDLVLSHGREFGSERISFQHANLITDPLPEGEVCFVRQVLQHLSNQQVAEILGKLETYHYALITEHYPRQADLIQPNVDKVQGRGVRLYSGSGLYLDQPPFGISPARLVPVLEVASVGFTDLPDPGVIRTYLLVRAEEGQAVRERLEEAGLLLEELS